MASQRQSVSFSAIIKGEGQEATCRVSATKVSLPGSGAVAYVDYFIRDEDVSIALPDGHYQVFVNGETQTVVRRNGFWVSP